MDVLIVSIEDSGTDAGLQLMIDAASVAAGSEGRITACVLTGTDGVCTSWEGKGLTEVVNCQKSDGTSWTAQQVVEMLAGAMTGKRYGLVIFENDSMGVQCCVRLADMVGGEATIESTNIQVSEQGLLMTKPIYSSNINAIYKIKKSICLATFRYGSTFETIARKVGKIVFTTQNYQFEEYGDIILREIKNLGTNSLENARIVVIGGRGIKNGQDLQMLEDFSQAIGAVTAGSRPLVMNGLMPVERMIGQSGKIVAPELCVVVGASGATPLLVGIRAAKVIIAINKDRDAGIFKLADIGIVADYHDVLPQLSEAVLA